MEATARSIRIIRVLGLCDSSVAIWLNGGPQTAHTRLLDHRRGAILFWFFTSVAHLC